MKKNLKNNNKNLNKISELLPASPALDEHFDIETRRELETRLFNSIENHLWHNSYDQEVRELSAITNGDIGLLEKSWKEWAVGKIGTMAQDSLRNEQNNAIVVITTSSRAAIRGGLNSEISFTLSDIYMSKVEEITKPGEAMKLARDAEYLYTILVHEMSQGPANTSKGSGNPHPEITNEHVDNCKDYVFRHLHEKIYVQNIAEALSINADYLSTVFKKHEGVTLTDYILHAKISLAKNLLIYSNYTYTEIANYLGFASQSHLGSRFKKVSGYTPKEYRMAFQMKDFMD